MCLDRPRELIRIEYHGECDVSSGSDALVHQAVALVDTLYLALVLGDTIERVESCGGTTNVAPNRAT